uniref:uncharacterized protein LOC122584917 isoform X2 n=1 Tax=Erigeron canadensis TaxID=72917 RepID=UPI001CB8FF57|nr:uncharacterized protein LOC122584917 isoform X2 [Erigeron canadensis]
MEGLYGKLYDKYTKLKAQKDNEKDQINYDQEEKFTDYVSAVDDLIAHLTSEKDRLSAEISDLRQQVITIRSAKDEEQEKYERMLIEESQKNKELSEEIHRLQNRESISTTYDDTIGSPLSSGRTNSSTKRKRRRTSIHDPEDEVALDVGGQHEQNNHTSPRKSENALEKENMFVVAFNNATQPKCCRQRLGDSASASDPTICMFQELVECLLNLKFSIGTQSGNNTQITAVHESSGYSFNLGWVKNELGDEELMYRASSLGTFERVAPEWMRDVIVFSKSMCHVFFKRVSAIL